MILLPVLLSTAFLGQDPPTVIAGEEKPYVPEYRTVNSDRFAFTHDLDISLFSPFMDGVTVEALHRLLPPDSNMPLKSSWQTHISIKEEESLVSRQYFSSDRSSRDSFSSVIYVYNSSKEAAEKFEQFYKPSGDKPAFGSQSAVPYYKTVLRGNDFPLNEIIGDDCWQEGTETPRGYIFRRGRCFVQIRFMSDLHPEVLVLNQALSRSIDYRILQNPTLSCETKRLSQTLIKGAAISTTVEEGIELVKAKDLERLGVRVNYKDFEGNPVAELSINGHLLSVPAYSNVATADGKPQKLEVPTFTYEGDIVLPLKSALKGLTLSNAISD